MFDPLSAGITAAGGIIGSIFGHKSQSDTNKANMELAKYQYGKALEMWNKQNEYNTPSAQRKRMEAAGFNPNLVYGHGSVANTASPAPQYQAPTLQAYTNFPNLGADVANILLASRKNKAEVRKIEAEASGAEQDARSKRIDADVKEKYGLESGMIDIRNKYYQNDLLGYQKQWEEERAKYSEDWVDALFRKDYREVERLEKEMALCDANIEKAKAAAENYKATTDYIKGPQTAQAYSAARLNNSNSRLADEKTTYQQFENSWYGFEKQLHVSKVHAETINIMRNTANQVLQSKINISDAVLRIEKYLLDRERLTFDEVKGLVDIFSKAVQTGIGVASLIP